MAAVKPSSSSSPHTLHRCLKNPQPLHRPSLFKPLFNSHDHKLPSVRCQIPKFEPKRLAKLRLDDNGKPYVTDNMNYIVDLYFKTPIKDAWAAGKEISAFEGVVEHGMLLDMTTAVIIAGKDGVSVKTK